MKGTILMIALLFVSVFAGALVVAEDSTGAQSVLPNSDDFDYDDASDEGEVVSSGTDTVSSDTDTNENPSTDSDVVEGVSVEGNSGEVSTVEAVEVADAVTDTTTSEDVEEALEEIAAPKNHKKVGFVRLSTFNGWAENGEIGSLINGFWAVQRFAEIGQDSDDVEAKVVKAFGRINIEGYGAYKIVRIRDAEEDNDTRVFHLISLRNERNYESETTLAEDSIGTLEVTKESEFGRLVTWNGELTLNEGEHAGTYDVELGSVTKTIKPHKAIEEGKKVGFWQKFKFWGRDKPEVNENSVDTQEANAKPSRNSRSRN